MRVELADRWIRLGRPAVVAVSAAVVAAAYLAWSWNAGDAAVVFDATMSTMPALSEGLAAFVPELGAEFWKHAATVAGVWMTLGSIVPDYAQRMTDAGEVAKGQILLLPALSAAAAASWCWLAAL